LAAVGAVAFLAVVARARGDDKPADGQSASDTPASANSKPVDAKSKPADATSKPAKGPAKAAFDPFKVPDGSNQDLLKFIVKVRNVRPVHRQSPAEAREFLLKKGEAIVAASDKILATKPDEKIRVSALQSKIQALAVLDDSGDDKAGTDLVALVGEIKDEKQPALAKLAKRYAAQAEEVTAAATAPKMDVKAAHLDGTPFDPSTIKGKVTLVEVWTTTCGNCRAEMPNIARDYAKYRDRGFEVVSISMDPSKALVQEFLLDNPSMNWQVLFAESGSMGVKYTGQVNGQFSTPKMMLVNKRGVLLSDSVSDQELTIKLAELLGP
jgi:thiol-disulfide isomerase/thioredoxin